MSNKANNQKRIVMSMGGKGGGGKSTLMTSLVDFFHAENCPVTLIDCDTENKVHGPRTSLLQADLDRSFDVLWIQLSVSYQRPKEKLPCQTSGF